MTEKERRKIGDALFARATAPQRTAKQTSEILEGLRAGLASDHLSLDEGLRKGQTVADPAKYTRAMDGHDERPRKVGPIVRDINERLERAKQEVEAETASPEYRAKVLRQKRTMIHRVMTERGTDELTANIRGYDVTLLRLPETGQDGLRKIKMFVNGNEISDKDFDAALAEVAGLNDGQAFNAAAQIGKDLKDQVGIQAARTATQAGIGLIAEPGKAVARSHQKNAAMCAAVMRIFLRMVLSISRAR